MTQAYLFSDGYDVCKNRHLGAETSIAANPLNEHKTYWQKQIIAYAHNGVDVWLKDVCRVFHKPANEISPRLSELKQMGLLVPTGKRIEKCAVFRLKK